MLGVAMLGVAGDMRGAVWRCFVRLFFCAALLLLLLAQRGKHGTVGLKAKVCFGRIVSYVNNTILVRVLLLYRR